MKVPVQTWEPSDNKEGYLNQLMAAAMKLTRQVSKYHPNQPQLPRRLVAVSATVVGLPHLSLESPWVLTGGTYATIVEPKGVKVTVTIEFQIEYAGGAHVVVSATARPRNLKHIATHQWHRKPEILSIAPRGYTFDWAAPVSATLAQQLATIIDNAWVEAHNEAETMAQATEELEFVEQYPNSVRAQQIKARSAAS